MGSVDPEALPDAQGSGLLDTVPGAKLAHRSVITDRQGAERIARLDSVELAGGLLGGFLGLRFAVLDLGQQDVLLFLLGLGDVVAVLVEVALV